MKNKIKVISILIIMGLIITGCDGNVTRDIRRDGYNIQDGKFVCSFFINKSKEENTTEKVQFLTNNFIISESGNVYEINIGGLYSNNMNCKKAASFDGTNGVFDGSKVVAIMDESIVKASNGAFYYLDTNDPGARFTRVTSDDKNYQIYKLLMEEEDVKKVVTVNSNTNNYYILKNDGTITNRVLYKKDNSDNYIVKSNTTVSNPVNGAIIDFNYAGDSSLATFYRTPEKIMTYKVTNSAECNKYVDVPCQGSLQNDTVLNEYKDRIIAFNGTTIITDYGRVFNVGS